MVSLTKFVEGKSVVSDSLSNDQVVSCPQCEQTYRLSYSDNEWHRLSAWLKKAEAAVRESHKKDHERDMLELIW
jgi:hypothetical protein